MKVNWSRLNLDEIRVIYGKASDDGLDLVIEKDSDNERYILYPYVTNYGKYSGMYDNESLVNKTITIPFSQVANSNILVEAHKVMEKLNT